MTPLIVGLSGPILTADESAFLREARPAGVILFRRNIADGVQLARLVGEVGEAAGSVLVLADQEGGRVQRLVPPLAPRYPAARAIGALYARDPALGLRAAWLQGRLIASDLLAFGITVPCLPVADVATEATHDAIGDRAYGRDPDAVAALAKACAEGVLAAGAVPVVKHMPGHGRASVDSHVALPRVRASRDALARDLTPFAALAEMPVAMTAHVVYEAIDPERPATLSPAVVRVMREEIGFAGLLLTDDIGMGALASDRAASAAAAVAAGCDVVLHCSGDLAEMERVAAALPDVSDAVARRIAAAQPRTGSVAAQPRTGSVAALDELRAEFADIVGALPAAGADPTRMAS